MLYLIALSAIQGLVIFVGAIYHKATSKELQNKLDNLQDRCDVLTRSNNELRARAAKMAMAYVERSKENASLQRKLMEAPATTVEEALERLKETHKKGLQGINGE